jgi:hypothetical protein
MPGRPSPGLQALLLGRCRSRSPPSVSPRGGPPPFIGVPSWELEGNVRVVHHVDPRGGAPLGAQGPIAGARRNSRLARYTALLGNTFVASLFVALLE